LEKNFILSHNDTLAMSGQAPCVKRLIDEKTISDIFKHCMLAAARFATNGV
jgi:hypothetical protein